MPNRSDSQDRTHKQETKQEKELEQKQEHELAKEQQQELHLQDVCSRHAHY